MTIVEDVTRSCHWLGLADDPVIAATIADLGVLAEDGGRRSPDLDEAIQRLYALMLQLEACDNPKTAARRACVRETAARGIDRLQATFSAPVARPATRPSATGQDVPRPPVREFNPREELGS